MAEVSFEEPLLSAESSAVQHKMSSTPMQKSTDTLTPPKFVLNILTLNAATNFAFYGVTAVLFGFLSDDMGFSTPVSVFITNTTLAVAYLSSMLGAWSAGRIGPQQTLLWAAFAMCVGLISVAVSQVQQSSIESIHRWLFFLGLLLVTVGYGSANANTSVMLGNQFDDSNKRLMPTYFSYWYGSVQCGAVISMITTATLLSAVPKYIAFAVLAAILALSLIVFRIPAKHYRRPAIVQRENQEMGPVRASVAVMLRRALRSVGFGRQSWSEEALADTYGDEAPYDASDLTALARLLFVPCTMYCAMYFQMFSLWQETAQEMNAKVLGITMPVDEVLALDPTFVLLFTPILARIYASPTCVKTLGKPVSRMIRGLCLSVATFIVAGTVQGFIAHVAPAKLSLALIMPQFALNASSELLFMATGIEFAYTVVRPELKAAVTAMWWIGVAAGTELIAVVVLATGGPTTDIQQMTWYFGSAGGMVVVVGLFYWLSRPFAKIHGGGGETITPRPRKRVQETSPLMESHV